MKVVVGITGASGAMYGIRLLQALSVLSDIETHLIVSSAGELIIAHETDWSLEEVRALADVVHDNENIGASISSGSFRRDAMVVAPCSIKTLSALACSYNSTLIARSGDVTLKERKKLVLVVRETPLHLGHLRHMTAVTEMGGVILPPVPAFYARPRSVDDVIDHTVGKILDVIGVEHDICPRWGGMDQA